VASHELLTSAVGSSDSRNAGSCGELGSKEVDSILQDNVELLLSDVDGVLDMLGLSTLGVVKTKEVVWAVVLDCWVVEAS